MTVAETFALARALGVAVDFLDCLVLVPPVILVSTLPISLAGWGVREGAMVAAFGLIGIAAYQALGVSVAFGLVAIVVGVPGGVVWLLGGGLARMEPR